MAVMACNTHIQVCILYRLVYTNLLKNIQSLNKKNAFQYNTKYVLKAETLNLNVFREVMGRREAVGVNKNVKCFLFPVTISQIRASTESPMYKDTQQNGETK